MTARPNPTRPWPRRAATAAGAALGLVLAGCGSTIRIVPEPLACAVADDVLAQRCAAPARLADGATYGQLVLASIDDRAALLACARHDQLLADALRECKAATERYRATIQDINRQTAAKP